MKNLLNIGRSLNATELKSITAGICHHLTTPDSCSAFECPEGACNLWGECIAPGGGGGGDICPENPGMQC